MDKVYLQKLIYLGTSVTKDAVKETGADFSVYPSEVPFIMHGEMKEDASRDWHDEHGLDVFYDSTEPPMKDYDIEIVCMAKADSVETLRKNVNAFIEYMSGGDGKGKVFAIYDTHCNAGRKDVRYTGFEEQSFYNFESDEDKFISFKIKMHVDDPKTEVTLATTNGTVSGLSYSE